MLHSISSMYGTTELKAAVIAFLRMRDSSKCKICDGSIALHEKPNLRWIMPEADATMDNLALIHHSCAYNTILRNARLAKPTQLAQASNPSVVQSTVQEDNKVYEVKQASRPEAKRKPAVACSLAGHEYNKSEVYMLKTCKHFLCAECEAIRLTQGECPVCLASAKQPSNPQENAAEPTGESII